MNRSMRYILAWCPNGESTWSNGYRRGHSYPYHPRGRHGICSSCHEPIVRVNFTGLEGANVFTQKYDGTWIKRWTIKEWP